MTKLKANKRRPDEAKAAIGVAGIVRKHAIAQNAFLATYAAPDPEEPVAVYRREIFDGRPHTVFPAVLAVEGVLNDALVSELELSKSVPAWNGRPVVLLHPEELGSPISASASPDVLERRVGTLFAASMDGKRLKAELWIDDQKMDHLGASGLVASMLGGEIVEVSTGYFSDDVIEQGEFNGLPYVARHTNLRPDHLALLPGQVGACSIMDGCGAPRINRSGLDMKSKIRDALAVLSKAVGIHTNACNCQECTSMNKLESVREDFKKLKLSANVKFLAAVTSALGLADDAAFKANAALESKHLKMLEDMDEGQLDMMAAMIQAYKATDPAAAADDDDTDPPNGDDPAMQQAKTNRRANEPVTMSRGELDTLIANAVGAAVTKAIAEQVPAQAARAAVTAKLKANAANPFTDEQLASLPVDALEKTELALRANDYSGAGGFPGNLSGGAADDEPLAIATNRKLEERQKARQARQAH